MLRSLSLGCVVTLALVPCAAQAAMMAFDSQADPVYTAWDPGDNGGTGWGGGWTFRNQGNTVLNSTSGNRGWFVASSTANNGGGGDSNGDGDVNSIATGKAWGVYSNTTDQVYAIRPFSGALTVGQTVEWDIDNGNIATDQVVGLRFLSNASDINTREFEVRFVGGNSFYTTVSSPNQTSTMGFTREGLHLEYTLTSASTFSLEITRLANGATQTITGANLSGNPLVALAFKNQLAGSGDAANGYLNNIRITPEPGTVALLALGAAVGLRRRASR